MRYYVAALLILVVFMVPWFGVNFPDAAATVISALRSAGEQIAAVVLIHKPVTVDQLKSDYAIAAIPGAKKIRILIVPGHEPDFGGTEYGDITERDLNVEVAENLISFLNRDPRYEIFTTRNKLAWSPEFANYFKTGWNDIKEWQKANRAEFNNLVKLGIATPAPPIVYHNRANPSVALRLHGINKWGNENNIDIAIHIHFNDYPRKKPLARVPGKYTGFAIYVPEQDYLNSPTTKAIANTVYKRLGKYNPVSNIKGERDGIVEEPDLIAIGSNNSVNAASMLIEYAYIYEPQLNDPAVRPLYLKELAYETYLGLMDFFDPSVAAAEAKTFDTLVLPYKWENVMTGKNDSTKDVFALQTALIIDGVYPPSGSSPNDCPRTGKLGPCTRSALKSFQEKYDISDEKGIAGPKTLETLNRVYSSQTL